MESPAPRLKKYSLSCRDREWEEVKERARRAGQSTSAYLVERALTVRLAPGAEPRREEALVLTEPEQRALVDRVSRIVEVAEASGERDDTLVQRIERGIAFLVESRMREMLAAGETAELEAIAEELFGARGRSGVRAWIA
ncbi:MAG: hypothetical protein OXF78_04400, partial [Rhodospirillales bacterium]|nr:hypothetical protein [Rhodospirillales bacterium]